jgi:hypothetical protein
MALLMAWLWFAVVQLILLVATVGGWFLLIPFCLLHAWIQPDTKSIKDDRLIDRWYLINFVYGNREDGVSGQQALINGNQPYMPNAWAPWRAYCWSALRNSCDNLKYVFAWKAGPFKQWTLFGRPQHAGWQMENGFNVPVISL